jgi:hypothetical protein
VALHPDDKEKIVFFTGQGLWQFTVIPCGPCNAQATFERLIDSVLRDQTFGASLVYLDIVVGRTFYVWLDNLQKFFQGFRGPCLKLNLERCRYSRTFGAWGTSYHRKERNTDPEKLQAVQRWPQTRDKHEPRSFLRLCTYYMRFIA